MARFTKLQTGHAIPTRTSTNVERTRLKTITWLVNFEKLCHPVPWGGVPYIVVLVYNMHNHTQCLDGGHGTEPTQIPLVPLPPMPAASENLEHLLELGSQLGSSAVLPAAAWLPDWLPARLPAPSWRASVLQLSPCRRSLHWPSSKT